MSAVAECLVRESEADYMSPVAVSIYCSPHPAALQIALAAQFRDSASRILRLENCFANEWGRGRGRGLSRQAPING